MPLLIKIQIKVVCHSINLVKILKTFKDSVLSREDRYVVQVQGSKGEEGWILSHRQVELYVTSNSFKFSGMNFGLKIFICNLTFSKLLKKIIKVQKKFTRMFMAALAENNDMNAPKETFS